MCGFSSSCILSIIILSDKYKEIISRPEFFNSRTEILPVGKYAGFAGEIWAFCLEIFRPQAIFQPALGRISHELGLRRGLIRVFRKFRRTHVFVFNTAPPRKHPNSLFAPFFEKQCKPPARKLSSFHQFAEFCGIRLTKTPKNETDIFQPHAHPPDAHPHSSLPEG